MISKIFIGLIFISLIFFVYRQINMKQEDASVQKEILSIKKNNTDPNNNMESKIEKMTFSNLGQAKEFSGIVGTINTDETSLQSILKKNKVVLFEFWTYTCINCKRTIPYLNDWYSKYHAQGFEIVGVHTPEFSYEKKKENIVEAAKEMGIKYPIFMDNDYATWNSYGNNYWPQRYLILPTGEIIYQHTSEGDYENNEKIIKYIVENN